MSEINVIYEKPITAVELKKRLVSISKRGLELKDKTAKVSEYLNTFVNLKDTKTDELKEKIMELDVPRLKERHIVKIMDIMPDDIDGLKILFVGDF